MKLASSFLLVLFLTSATLSRALVTMDESSSITDMSDDENRNLGAGARRRKIKPKGAPKVVDVTSKGKIKRRRSILDLSGLLLDDTVQDVDVQLMSDEQSQTLRMTRRANTNNDPFESWYGRDAKTGNHLTIVKTTTQWGDTVTTGTMHGQNGTVYQIRTLATGDVVAEEIKQEMFDKELDGVSTYVKDGDGDIDPETIDAIDGLPGGGRRGLRNLRRLDSSNQLDVMVLYTKGAMCSAAGYVSGGTCTATAQNLANIEGIIALAVVETNKAYELSGIPTSFRLVKTHYDDSYNDYSSTWSSTLSNLRNNGDGTLDYVHAMRDQYGADFVSMLVDTSGACGIGYLALSPDAAYAFTLAHWDCATGYYSFGHEIGHNMGCKHDVLNAGGYSGGYNYGYQDPLERFRSIMAYDCSTQSCPRVQYFSSPELTYITSPLGTATANNALVIRENLAAYANFRQSIPVNPPPVSSAPTAAPTAMPTTAAPTALPTTTTLTAVPTTAFPTVMPTTAAPTATPTTAAPTAMPTTAAPTAVPTTTTPTAVPTTAVPTVMPTTAAPTATPTTAAPTDTPTTAAPTAVPTTTTSTAMPTTAAPTATPTMVAPTATPTTAAPTAVPTTTTPTAVPTTAVPTVMPTTAAPTATPTTAAPTAVPTTTTSTAMPTTAAPTATPTMPTTASPTAVPTKAPTAVPTKAPTATLTRTPTAVPTKAPTVAPTTANVRSLTTTFAGGYVGAAGHMFDIKATKNLNVTNFAVHASSASLAKVEVYMKTTTGTFSGTQSNPAKWRKIGTATFRTNAAGRPSILPVGTFSPITVGAGVTQAFYITFTNANNLNRYSTGLKRGKVQAFNSDLTIYYGYAKFYLFGLDVKFRAWNGILYYRPI